MKRIVTENPDYCERCQRWVKTTIRVVEIEELDGGSEIGVLIHGKCPRCGDVIIAGDGEVALHSSMMGVTWRHAPDLDDDDENEYKDD